jgi:capsular polysaccharide biosynthesis protein
LEFRKIKIILKAGDIMNSKNEDYSREYYDEYEIDLREYILLIWNHKWFIVGLVVLAVLAAFIFSSYFIEAEYKTEAKIQLSNYEGIYSQPSSAVQMMQSNDLIKGIIEEVGIDLSSGELRSFINNNINASHISNTSIISLSVTYREAGTAVKIAENIINKYKNNSEVYFSKIINNKEEFVKNLESDLEGINQSIDKNNDLIEENREAANYETVKSLLEENASLKKSRQELRLLIQEEKQQLLEFYPLQTIDSPYSPENPVSPNIKLNIAIAAVLAFMLAIFIVFFKEFMKEEEEKE